jgi:hypothetical protein
MIQFKTALIISLSFIVYFLAFFMWETFIKSGSRTMSTNKTIEELRTKYKINIRTFYKNNSHYGFSWFKAIWLNEKLFGRDEALRFTFHHEYYHLKHNHKLYIVLMRLVFSLEFILLSITPWYLFVPLILLSAYIIGYFTMDNKGSNFECKFEREANNYAREMMANEGDSTKREV